MRDIDIILTEMAKSYAKYLKCRVKALDNEKTRVGQLKWREKAPSNKIKWRDMASTSAAMRRMSVVVPCNPAIGNVGGA